MKITFNAINQPVTIPSLKFGNTYYDKEEMRHYMICSYSTDEKSWYKVDFSLGIIKPLLEEDMNKKVIKTNVEAIVNAA